jgi:TPR repeat protein
MHWFRLAAAQDLPAAYNGLAILHYHGQGVPVNFTLAREMWHKGAALKDHDSLFNLGMMYNSKWVGSGVWGGGEEALVKVRRDELHAAIMKNLCASKCANVII